MSLARGCIAALLLAALPARAGELRVNSGAWDLTLDDNLTLYEAVLLARWPQNSGEKPCWRTGEKDRTSGGNWELANSFNSPNCAQTPTCPFNPSTCLWVLSGVPSYGIGADHADVIRIVANVGPVQPNWPVYLGANDQLQGLRPDGQRLVISGVNLPSFHAALVDLHGANARVTDVEVTASPRAGVGANGNGARVESSFIHDNAGAGVHLRVREGGPGPYSPRDITIGSTDPARGNFIVGNGGDGILLEGVDTETGFNHNNKFFANFISGHGASGIAVFRSRGNLIGDTGLGNEIRDSSGLAGIFIEGQNAVGNRISGNLIGVTSGSGGNHHGIEIVGGASASVIGGSGGQANRIVGNRGHGISIRGPDSVGHQILGNLIGLSGNNPVGNRGDGIRLHGGVRDSLVRGNTVVSSGQPTALDEGSGWGVRIEGAGSRMNRIEQNQIGHFGAQAAGNRRGGVAALDGSEQTAIGGASLGNTIVSNAGPGVLIEGPTTTGTLLQHNRIGFLVEGGAVARPNAGSGVLVRGGARNTAIGAGDGSAADSSRRNWISTNGRDGIEVLGDTSDGVAIRNNYIGTELIGLGAIGNSRNGIYVQDADGIVIERNLVSGNGNDGIKLEGSVAAAQIDGNTVGLNIERNEVLGNGASGIALVGGPTDAVIGGSASNYIGGSGNAGVFLHGSSTRRIQVRGNYIGGTGTQAFANSGSGVYIGGGSADNLVRSNLLLGNGVAGIDLSGAHSNHIAANFVGGISSGAVFRSPRGIRIASGSVANIVGGQNVEDRNYITAGSFYGVSIFSNGSNGNRVENNWIGQMLGGGAAGVQGPGVLIQDGPAFNLVRSNLIAWSLGPAVWIRNQGNPTRDNMVMGNTLRNGVVEGVRISDGASFNQIGGQTATDINMIRDNDGSGIVVAGGNGNAMWGNVFLGNAGMSVDLGDDGPTPNDPGDLDSGPNRLQNHPVLGTVQQLGSEARVPYLLDSTPQRSFRIELYMHGGCAPGGGGQGTSIWAVNVHTDSNGRAEGVMVLPYVLGGALSATATDLNSLDTSELGGCTGEVPHLFSSGFE